ncbi:MAG: phosphoethanolamine transferase [Prevotella sp.]|nr:phosphoethanolamine transferase [Prevotella sp.]MCM1074730.1 phosphoethanolamine transferase [Ruminococcus sp.]
MSVKQKIVRCVASLKENWLNALTDVYVRTPGLMLLLVTMQFCVPAIKYVFLRSPEISESSFAASCILSANSIVLAWTALTIYNLLKKINNAIGKIWLILTLLIFFFNWLVDFALLTIYNQEFSSDIAGALVVTDFDESSNFLSSYLNLELLAIMSAYFALFAVMYFMGDIAMGKYLKRLITKRLMWRYILLSFTALCWIYCLAYPKSQLTDTGLPGKISTFAGVDLGHPIVPQHPKLIFNTDDAPSNIVLIIGESHSSSHSSLYGYYKPTEPRLAELANDSLLYVFASATSPALHTMESLQQMIGTYAGEPERKWYDCVTFLEVANIAGYKTLWLSNQAAIGFHDNPISEMAKFCDIQEFTDTGMRISSEYDEDLLPLIKKHMNDKQKALTILHLQGSHVDYAHRSPEAFKHFKPRDYNLPSERQRKVIAEYDNSLLYNDYVVDKIINEYSDKDAIVIYLSDHGQDLFQSTTNFFGHGKTDDKMSMKVASEVPFLVYLSPEFKAKHKEITARIAGATSRHVLLTDLIYTLMDVMSVSFETNQDVNSRSFFRPINK